MLTNPRSERVRAVRALARRPVRSRRGLFLAEGPQSVREALAHHPELVRDVYVTGKASTRHTAMLDAAAGTQVPVHEVSEEVLAAMSDTQTPQGLLAVCRVPATSIESVVAAGPRLVCVLADVRDPGNAGTVVRAADAAGADAVVLTGSSVDPWAPKVVRASAGSVFHLPVVTSGSMDVATSFSMDVATSVSMDWTLGSLRAAGIAVLAADVTGEQLLHEADLARPHAWVLGNEAWGLDAHVRERCDAIVRVPIYGKAESLNLAMAATVCLYASAAAAHR